MAFVPQSVFADRTTRIQEWDGPGEVVRVPGPGVIEGRIIA
jgi:hypothetical protein